MLPPKFRICVAEAPKFSVVAAPKAFTVVAVVLRSANVVEGVVNDVVNAGLVIDCTPVNVFAASVRAAVKFASGKVTVRAVLGPVNVSCCPKIGSVLAALGRVTV